MEEEGRDLLQKVVKARTEALLEGCDPSVRAEVSVQVQEIFNNQIKNGPSLIPDGKPAPVDDEPGASCRQRLRLQKREQAKARNYPKHNAERRRRAYQFYIADNPSQCVARLRAVAQLWILSLERLIWEDGLAPEQCKEAEARFLAAEKGMDALDYKDTSTWPDDFLLWCGANLQVALMDDLTDMLKADVHNRSTRGKKAFPPVYYPTEVVEEPMGEGKAE